MMRPTLGSRTAKEQNRTFTSRTFHRLETAAVSVHIRRLLLLLLMVVMMMMMMHIPVVLILTVAAAGRRRRRRRRRHAALCRHRRRRRRKLMLRRRACAVAVRGELGGRFRVGHDGRNRERVSSDRQRVLHRAPANDQRTPALPARS